MPVTECEPLLTLEVERGPGAKVGGWKGLEKVFASTAS